MMNPLTYFAAGVAGLDIGLSSYGPLVGEGTAQG